MSGAIGWPAGMKIIATPVTEREKTEKDQNGLRVGKTS